MINDRYAFPAQVTFTIARRRLPLLGERVTLDAPSPTRAPPKLSGRSLFSYHRVDSDAGIRRNP
jgi:hypothetical protein